MNTYLVIMVTILLLTQIVRLTQNHKQLKGLDERMEENERIVQSWKSMVESMDNLTIALKQSNIDYLISLNDGQEGN